MFCEKYVENGYNSVQAYVDAFGCSRDSASGNAHRMFKKQEVLDYIGTLQKEVFEYSFITAERIANELASMAFAEKGDQDYPASVKLKALDLLQKQLNLQNQKVNVESKGGINIQIGE